jgi:hypothetical protein
MSPLANSERQKRFRQLTLRERQLKADAFDVLIAAIESKQPTMIQLPDGRQLKVDPRRNDEARVQIVADAKMQSEIARARFLHIYGE